MIALGNKIPNRRKKSRGEVTKFFASDKIFPRRNFSPTFFFPTSIFPRFFFTWQRIYPNFFSIFIVIFSYLFAKFIINMFFIYYVLYLSWLSKAVLKKILKCEWNQGIEKNSNKNYINTTRNCTFVNFKNYSTLKSSKRIGFKLVLIISRTKERVFNSFKDFIWFFNRLCYPRWFKSIQNQTTAPLQVLVHLIDSFCG